MGARLRRGEGAGQHHDDTIRSRVCGRNNGGIGSASDQTRPNNTHTGNKIGYGGEGHVATEKAVLAPDKWRHVFLHGHSAAAGTPPVALVSEGSRDSAGMRRCKQCKRVWERVPTWQGSKQ